METSKSWSKSHYFFLFLLVAIGVALRFYEFDVRPLHHDESLHGLYSLYFYQDSANGFYKYNPLLHGPLLYHSLPWSYWLFGVSKFAIRAPSVLLGSLLLFLPFLFRHRLSRYTVLGLTLLIASSPTMIYWSRFIRHDNFIFAANMLLLFALIKTVGIVRYTLVAMALSLQFACKENSFIHIIFFLAFNIYEFFVIKVTNSPSQPIGSRFLRSIINHKWSFLVSISLFIFIFSHYYTAGFVYWDGLLDGAYKKSLLYWFEQHQKERISGPFSYSFLINSFFESWWIPALIAHLVLFYKKQSSRVLIIFLSSFGISFLLHISFGEPVEYYFLSKLLKLKIPLDYYLFFPLIFHSLILTTVYIIEQRRELALSGFFFFASLFTYSYLGEKVPWLALYPLVTGVIFFAFFFDRIFQKPILIVLLPLLFLNIKTMIWSNYTHSAHPNNLLSQVHTTSDFENLMTSTRKKMDQTPTKYLLIADSYTWPTTWYLHGSVGYHFREQGKAVEGYEFVLSKPEDERINILLSPTHEKLTIPLRSWWLPRYEEITFSKAWNYFIQKEPWNGTGSNQVSLWTLKK
jgi:uncharacterized protein (TIGR03663 family)